MGSLNVLRITRDWRLALSVIVAFTALSILVLFSTPAFAAGKNGTTLAASKTLEICEEEDGSWTYSGLISIWNQGVIDTFGLSVSDVIQNKTGTTWTDAIPVANNNLITDYVFVIEGNTCPKQPEVGAGTTDQTACVISYSVNSDPMLGSIRNVAKVTILNHSGPQFGRPFGPEPKYTFSGEVLPCENELCGCVYTQGYWGSKPNVDWPSGYDRNNCFWGFNSTTQTCDGQIWQQVLETPARGNNYYILAYQYIAAVLNAANNACVPSGVQSYIDLATGFFSTATPATCSSPGSCGLQNTWAGILDQYNNGNYPDGPEHCGDE